MILFDILSLTFGELPAWAGGLLDITAGMVGGYLVYRYMAWRNDQMIKRMHPDQKNGLNLDVSYKIDGSEVFGLHGRGVNLGDMIDNMFRGFSAWSHKKDMKVNMDAQGNYKKQ
jgi:hypothetical protein